MLITKKPILSLPLTHNDYVVMKKHKLNPKNWPLLRRRHSGGRRPWFKDTSIVFAIGVLIGVTLAVWVHHSSDYRSTVYQPSLWQYLSPDKKTSGNTLTYLQGWYDFRYEQWLSRLFGGQPEIQDPDVYRYNNSQKYSNVSGFITSSEAHFLYSKVPVVCVVFNPESTKSVSAVVHTWGKHCNEIRFYYTMSRRSSFKPEERPVIFNVTSSPVFQNNPHLVGKVRVVDVAKAQSEFGLMCRAFRQVFKHHRKRVKANLEPAPWVLVAPDNSFVLTENLRFYVAPMNQSQGHYLGHAMQFWGSTYNWMAAGFAMSWPAVSSLVAKFPTEADCDKGGKFWKNGDWYLGKHLHSLNVDPVDTRDHIGRGRFNGYSMRKLLFPGGVSSFERYWKDSFFGAPPDGPGCCSNFAITFSGVLSKSKMHQQEYLHHHLRPFSAGGSVGNQPAKINLIDKHPALTVNEYLKEQKMGQVFDPTLTTPKIWAMHD